MSPAARLTKISLSALPWLIIAGLLWAGIAIKPRPVGSTVQPPVIERRDAFYGIASPAPGVLWVVGNDGKIIRSDDGGASWKRQETPVAAHLQDIAAWDADRAVVVGNSGVVIVTADGGTQWTEVQAPRSKVSNKLLRVKSLPGGRGWAVGEMGALLHSADYGQTWERRRDEEDTAWNDVTFADEKNGWVVGEAGRMLRTSDGGQSWEVVPTAVKSSLMGVAFSDAANGVAVGLEGVILLTRDAGTTWRRLPAPKRPARHIGTGKTGGSGAVNRVRALEDATEHLYDVVWDPDRNHWLAVGNQGAWARARKDADSWEGGHLDFLELAWHTRIVASNGRLYVAGATVGEWGGQDGSWRAFGGK